MPTLERAGAGGVIVIDGFSGHGFRIGESRFDNGLLIWPEGAAAWAPPAFDALAEGDLAALDAADPPLDLLLVGTGAMLRRVPAMLTSTLEGRGLGVEAMDSRAAARTYNLLAGEGRRVGAALYPLNA